MIEIEINDAVIIEQRKALEAALSTNPDTAKKLREVIRLIVMQAREEAIAAARSSLQSDPRGAIYSIRSTVYKKVLGANLNIYNSRKAGKPAAYEPVRTLREGQRGGNRVARSERTKAFDTYGPHDRGFILRFLNSGTGQRTAGTRGGKLGGNRGSIAARNFFRGAAEPILVKAADNLANLIDEEMETILNLKK